MAYYSAHYGTWRGNDKVTHISFGEGGCGPFLKTPDRKEAFEKAQAVADEVQREVTILEERPTGRGLAVESYKIQPRSMEA